MLFKSGYSAPEQYTSSANRYGPWTDIYAAGATLYRAIAGDRPIESTERSLKDQLQPATAIGSGRYREGFSYARSMRPFGCRWRRVLRRWLRGAHSFWAPDRMRQASAPRPTRIIPQGVIHGLSIARGSAAARWVGAFFTRLSENVLRRLA